MTETVGSCLCKAVEISVTDITNEVGACHCSICRNWGGGAFMSIEADNGVSIAGEENIAIYDSSEWAERGFCKSCGTHLFYRLKANQQYFFTAGIFPELPNQTFTHQVFIDEKPQYYSFKEVTHDMTGEQVFAQFTND